MVAKGIQFVLLIMLSLAVAQAQDLASLRQTVDANPSDASAWVALGDAYLTASDLEQAEAAFFEAIALDYLNGDAHFGYGLVKFNQGDLDAALFEFSEMARLYPERFDAHFNRAVTLANLDIPDEAVAAFREAISEAEPEASTADIVAAYTGMAGQYIKLQSYSDAADAYEAAQEVSASNELAFLQAEALNLAGRGLEALPILTMLEPAMRDHRISTLRADIYIAAGQPDFAMRALERALGRAQENTLAQASILVKMGLIQRDQGEEAAAVSSFQNAVRLDPGNLVAYYNLGVALLDSERYMEAVPALEAAFSLNRSDGNLRLALATAYDNVQRVSEAAVQAEAALEVLEDPGLVLRAQFILGRSLYMLGRYNEALEQLEEVVAAEPGNALAQTWVGLTEYALGNYDGAASFYERAVQLEPDNINAMANLGAAYLASKRYADAELIYQLIVDENERDGGAYYHLGWSLLSQNQRTEARSAFERAVELGYQPAVQILIDYF